MYDIEYSAEALADLERFKKHEQNVIVDGIEEQLRYEPTSKTRNRKNFVPMLSPLGNYALLTFVCFMT